MPIIQTNSGYGYIYRSSETKIKKIPTCFKFLFTIFLVVMVGLLATICTSNITNFFGINSSNVFSKKSLYALSVGEFDDYSSASLLSQTILKQGGAGFIEQNNGKYYVLLSCYEQQTDAENVILNLSNSGIDATMYVITLKGMSLNWQLNTSQFVVLKKSINLFYDCYKFLYDLSLQFDNQSLTKSNALECLDEQMEHINTQCASFDDLVCDSQNASTVYMKIFLNDLLECFMELSTKSNNFSGEIKNTYFKVLKLYVNLHNEIGN